LSLDVIRSDIIGPLLELSKDHIPNIRFNVAKSLEAMATTFKSTAEGRQFIQEFILPTLEQQKNDVDADVRYFASRALQKALSSPES
jgi:serine/threonine-protein phosphatase 2A regulatory subunit A